jgi:hypothetical protein
MPKKKGVPVGRPEPPRELDRIVDPTKSLSEKSGSGPITRRKEAQKRRIYVICEHFDTLSNAVSGP